MQVICNYNMLLNLFFALPYTSFTSPLNLKFYYSKGAIVTAEQLLLFSYKLDDLLIVLMTDDAMEVGNVIHILKEMSKRYTLKCPLYRGKTSI
jgi:hypothetical protein